MGDTWGTPARASDHGSRSAPAPDLPLPCNSELCHQDVRVRERWHFAEALGEVTFKPSESVCSVLVFTVLQLRSLSKEHRVQETQERSTTDT